MDFGKYKTREVQPTVLRLHPDLRDALVKLAEANKRSLTKEIADRLQNSLAARGPTLQGILAREADAKAATYKAGNTPTVVHANDNGPASALSDTDRAMLAVFRSMPVEKQLALLSLFK